MFLFLDGANVDVVDEDEANSPELGRRQRRKRSHSMIAPQGLPTSNAIIGTGMSPLVASIPSRASVDMEMRFVNVPEAGSLSPPAVATIGSGGPIHMKKRGKLPKDVTETLRGWLMAHKSHPYPSEEEKRLLCAKTQLNMSQVSNWMINVRCCFPSRRPIRALNDGFFSSRLVDVSLFHPTRSQQGRNRVSPLSVPAPPLLRRYHPFPPASLLPPRLSPQLLRLHILLTLELCPQLTRVLLHLAEP